MRDMSWDEQYIPRNLQPWMLRFYAWAQFAAIVSLVSVRPHASEHAFAILFAIQLSTFLMSLRLKGFIGNDTWHTVYAMSLLATPIVGTGGSQSDIIVLFCMINGLYVWRIWFRFSKYSGFLLLLGLEYSHYSAPASIATR